MTSKFPPQNNAPWPKVHDIIFKCHWQEEFSVKLKLISTGIFKAVSITLYVYA